MSLRRGWRLVWEAKRYGSEADRYHGNAKALVEFAREPMLPPEVAVWLCYRANMLMDKARVVNGIAKNLLDQVERGE
jgi:hypothetical protein